MKGWTALLWKETEALLPYWVAFSVLIVFNFAAVFWAPSYVEDALGVRFSNGADNAFTLGMLSLLIGHGAVAHELRDGHVEFLDALPIGRGRIFAAKVLAAALPCVVVVLASLAMDVTLAAVARPPHAVSPLQPILVMHAMMFGSAAGGLGLGMLLSWLGPLAWGVLGVMWFTAGCLGVVYPPTLGWVPLFGSYGTLQWDHGTASHPLGPPLGFAVSGVLATGLSGLLFLGPGHFLTVRGSHLVTAVRLGLGGCLGLVLWPIGALVSALLVFQHGGTLLRGVDVLPTRDFRVLYAPPDFERARVLADEVDALSAEVGALVGHPEPLHLDIELLGAPQNHLGVFTGGKIRLANSAELDTLAHELTHAHAFALAGRAGWDQQDHTHFFEEGLADWVQARIAGEPEVPDVAGAVWSTGQGRFEDLVDHDRFVARHDIRQSYVLGQAFVSALVEVAGPGSPGCLLSHLRDVGPRPVAGLALWYGLAVRCDLDLDQVRDRWEAMLEERERTLPALPRLRAGVVADPPSIWVRDERDLGWDLLCGFRDGPEVPPNRWVYGPAVDGTCRLPAGELAGLEFQYQVGYRLPTSEMDGLSDVYLEWTDARR